MINKTSKTITSLIFVIFLTGCAPFFSSNRFERSSVRNSFSFGLASHDAFGFCRKNVPNFIGKYSNNVSPTRNCTKYQYYTCHVNHYCKGDKQCEKEAAQYWIPSWTDAHGNLEKEVEISKQVCEFAATRCNSPSVKMGDQTCRVFKEDKPKNSPINQ